jgi:para-nitrobenzyl esterase
MKPLMKKLILFLLATAQVYMAIAQTNNLLQVKTANGLLQGAVDSSGIRSFKGIPFARPPVGDLRWKEPQPPANWKGVRDAGHFGPQAMQRRIYSDMMFRSAGTGEDCLYLNVWTPAKSANEKLPVLVYFYGGGFSAGDGSEYRYDGESLAKMGIVTITINYRLGIFGFLAHPDLTNESPHHSSGNYGLMDQHAALLWVKKNIAAFGGDPNKVTIGGESAGSMSVSVQVASPLSKGLFRGAIAESGAGMGNLTPAPLADAEQNGIKFAQKAGAASIADLRKIPADSLLKMSGLYRFGPDIDGYFLPQTPTAISVAGMEMRVPLLAGWNSAEGDYHGILGNDSTTVDNYKAVLKRLYGANADAIFNAYPAATPYEVKVAATSLASDRFIAYSTWKFIDLQSKTGGKPVYRYFFSQVRQPAGGSHGTVMGASHSSEIEYALGNLATNKAYSWSVDDYKVSETMESYFANFIKTGDPNGPGLPQWYSLQAQPPRIMVIDINTHAEPEKNAQRYMLLDSLYKQANQVR